MIVLPVLDTPYFSEVLVIESKTYEFSFAWNHRANYWTISIKDENDEVLISGVKLNLNFDLLRRYRKDILPLGSFIAVRDGINNAKIEYDELGNTVKIVYAEEAEYAAL